MFWDSKPEPSTEAEFDIEGIDVFSIERDDSGETRFGYRRTETVFTQEGTAKERAFVARLTKKIQAREAAKGETNE